MFRDRPRNPLLVAPSILSADFGRLAEEVEAARSLRRRLDPRRRDGRPVRPQHHARPPHREGDSRGHHPTRRRAPDDRRAREVPRRLRQGRGGRDDRPCRGVTSSASNAPARAWPGKASGRRAQPIDPRRHDPVRARRRGPRSRDERQPGLRWAGVPARSPAEGPGHPAHDRCDGSPIHLEIDGGIAPDTVALATEAGARVLVAGNAVFSHPPYADAIAGLRREGERGVGLRDDTTLAVVRGLRSRSVAPAIRAPPPPPPASCRCPSRARPRSPAARRPLRRAPLGSTSEGRRGSSRACSAASRSRVASRPRRPVPGVLLERPALIARVKDHVARELPPEAIRNEGLALQLFGFIPTAVRLRGRRVPAIAGSTRRLLRAGRRDDVHGERSRRRGGRRDPRSRARSCPAGPAMGPRAPIELPPRRRGPQRSRQRARRGRRDQRDVRRHDRAGRPGQRQDGASTFRTTCSPSRSARGWTRDPARTPLASCDRRWRPRTSTGRSSCTRSAVAGVGRRSTAPGTTRRPRASRSCTRRSGSRTSRRWPLRRRPSRRSARGGRLRTRTRRGSSGLASPSRSG